MAEETKPDLLTQGGDQSSAEADKAAADKAAADKAAADKAAADKAAADKAAADKAAADKAAKAKFRTVHVLLGVVHHHLAPPTGVAKGGSFVIPAAAADDFDGVAEVRVE
jgi:membrane protein involved in colicin uptake